MMKSKTISISISVPPATAYEFAANPENLPRWAPAFCLSLACINGEWVVQTPDAAVTVRFAERNAFGVVDHIVGLSSGIEILIPMRVIPNGDGSEVIFTLFRQPGMSDEQFAADARLVESDLGTLKRILETRGKA